MTLYEILTRNARDAGFPLAGTVDIAHAQAELQAHVAHYDHWLSRGREATMEYLRRGRDRRADPRLVFPQARSVLSVAIPYPRNPAGAASPAEGPRYARYLNGADYHKELAARLERALQRANAEWTALGGPALTWKVCVDTSAVLERAWAAMAGLGWIGKNTLLIHPKLGSYLFIAEALIDQETGQAPSPIADLCGNCSRCLQGCPTGAITGPRELDANRCISYWTLEKRGELPLSEQDRRAIGPWVAGCDLCQEACPFNLKPSREAGDTQAAAIELNQWLELLAETPEAYRERVRDSALKRVKPEQFSRNLALALTGYLTDSPEQMASFREAVKARLERETDPVARSEWARCLDSLVGSAG